jgi:hypothetical protein
MSMRLTTAVFFSFVFIFSSIARTENDSLYQGFVNPPAEVGPDVYWWWNANALSEAEISRELDVLHDAGIHGVLIFPLASPLAATKTEEKQLKWLSPEWCQMLKYTLAEAKKRGIYVDVLVGTGWPFGGPFVEPNDQIKIIRTAKKELKGPATFKANIKDLMLLPLGAWGETTNGQTPELKFLRLQKKHPEMFEPGTEYKDKVQADGSIEIEVPDGEYILYTGTYREGFLNVNISAPGGEGRVIDHMSRKALDHYLAYFENALKPYLGEKIGKDMRSLHCDSYEFTNANWTTDLPEEFQKRRGYSIEPYLPFILDWPAAQGGPGFSEAVNRAQFDLWKTQKELFTERFLLPFRDWCHRMGTDFRTEAYGCFQTDHLEAKLFADRPMGETWISMKREIPPTEIGIPVEKAYGPRNFGIWSCMSNKYTASGAHLTGRHQVSCETMTSGSNAFRLRLADIKMGLDMDFVSGINHTFYHGYNVSPPQAGFPGWFYCGSYIDEKELWWPYFGEVNKYNSRLSWILQKSTSRSQVALISWETYLWEALHQNGWCVDYVNEGIIQNAKFDGGKLTYGPQSYDVLMLNRVDAVEPDTAKALFEFAKAGGKIVFVDHAPDHAPGLTDFAKRSKDSKEKIESIFKQFPDNAFVVSGADANSWINWVGPVMAKTAIKPAVEISKPDKLLYQVHQVDGGRDIFFFANLDVAGTKSFTAQFATGKKIPWKWDPFTGKREVYPYHKDSSTLELQLKPQESLLLVFDDKLSGKPEAMPVADATNYYEIKTPWELVLNHVSGCTIKRNLPQLIDFKDDTELVKFSGNVLYRTEFDVPDKSRTLLTLGEVFGISEVTLNGKKLGNRWFGEHSYNVAEALKSGRNVLEIKVVTTLSNFMRCWDNPVAKVWTQDKGQDRDVTSEGLIGPVRLVMQK